MTELNLRDPVVDFGMIWFWWWCYLGLLRSKSPSQTKGFVYLFTISLGFRFPLLIKRGVLHYKRKSGLELNRKRFGNMMARKRQRSSNSDDATKNQLMELPVDTLVNVLLRLPVKSVGCIKCVSKTLLNMVNNISFSTLHTRSLVATNPAAAADQVPRLMCCSRDHPLVTLQSLKYKDNTLTKGRYAITISSSSTPCKSFLRFVLCNVFCLGSKNGDCMLINPLGERGVLRLPETGFDRPESYSWFGMGFDDKTNTYKIVCVCIHDRRKSMTAHVLVLGTNSWRQISSIPPSELSCITDKLVCANGGVHWLGWGRVRGRRPYCRIVSFDFRREEFCLTPTPPTLDLESNIYLFTLRGCLAIAETKLGPSMKNVTTGLTMEVWVLNDLDEKQWTRYYYSNNLPAGFPYEFHGGFPGEWEHGIFMTDNNISETSVFFIDLRSGSINSVKYNCATELLGLYSYSETLISLKDYGDLEEANEMII